MDEEKFVMAEAAMNPGRLKVEPDFKPWDELLRRYVNQQGQVHYQAWQAESLPELRHWLHQLSSIDPQSLSLSQQLALWLNLYNALVILQVLERYPMRSIRPKILGIPNWLSFFRFFQRPIYTLNRQSYSLNLIEHGILRQQFHNPQIHFALVCAAIGCPLLRPQAYFPDAVESQLEEDAKRFIHNPTKVRFDLPTQTLYCSKIFKWYGEDFLEVADSIPRYIAPYLGLSLTNSTRLRYLDYDWRLNQRTSS